MLSLLQLLPLCCLVQATRPNPGHSVRPNKGKPLSLLLSLRQGQKRVTDIGSTVHQWRGGSITPKRPSQRGVLAYNVLSADPGATPIQELWDQLQSSPTGLSSQQATQRMDQYGPNVLESPPGKNTWQLIVEQFQDRLVQILLGVAVLSGIFSVYEMRHAVEAMPWWKSFVEPLVIVAILFLNAAVGVWQSQSAQGSLEALTKMQPSLATVIREDGSSQVIDASLLVPGDVLEIRVGDKIPADARLLQLMSSSMQVDEGSLTGESVTVPKFPGDEGTVDDKGMPLQDQRGMLYSGTMVTSGSGRALVVQTGMATQMGKIQQGVTDAKDDQPKTPLAIKLDEFGNTLTMIIGAICLTVWLFSIPKMNDPSFSSVWEGAVYYAKVAVALGVAAIPEGLPAVITLCLSLGTRRMAQRNVIVRKLPSVETLGCTSVICTDKTGTLTTNEMTAVSLVLVDGPKKDPTVTEHGIEGFSYLPRGRIDGIDGHDEIKGVPRGAVADVAAVAALCNDAAIVGNDGDDSDGAVDDDHPRDDQTQKRQKDKHHDDGKAFERIGEPTEAALCVLTEKLGGTVPTNGKDPDTSRFRPSQVASEHVDRWRSSFPRKATLEFNRDRKSMSVLCTSSKGKNRLLVKGAPNLLIRRCTHVKLRDGKVVKLSGALRRSVEAKVKELASRPLRCIALAVKETDKLESSLRKVSSEADVAKNPLLSNPKRYADIESGLTLVGIVGIKDPARPEVADSINQCTEAGIRVMMITGDAKDTAIAIAKDVNIFPKNVAMRKLKVRQRKV